MLSAPARIACALLVAALLLQDRGTDLVMVDVQVVDRDGNPVSTLGKADFEVSIDGRTRRVISSEFISTSAGVCSRCCRRARFLIPPRIGRSWERPSMG